MSTASIRRPPPAVPADFALTLLQESAAIGEDPDCILERLRLPVTVDDLRSGRVATLADGQFIQLCRECITLLANRANRERNLPPMSKDEVDMLCYCVITCVDLEEVILRAARFCAMLGGRAGRLWLGKCGDVATFHMQTFRLPNSISGLLADLTGLSFYHRLFSWLIGEAIPIPGFSVTYDNRGNDATLLRLFHHPILYGQSDNQFSFPAHCLDKPVVRSYQRLVELLTVFPFDVMCGPGGQSHFSEAVEHLVLGQLARGEPIRAAGRFANFFGVSVATFRRRLAEEGTSLSEIKEHCRIQLAAELLGPQSRLKIADIGLRMGFSDARAFRRAFRTWTGESPEAFRARVSGHSASGRHDAAPALSGGASHAPRRATDQKLSFTSTP